MILTLTLPWPPTANLYWRHPNRGPLVGHHLISAAGRTYRTVVKRSVVAIQPFGGRLHVTIHAYPPDRRRRDLDNLTKGLLDALTHAGVWTDDEQIDHLEIIRHEVEPGGAIEVVVTPYVLDEEIYGGGPSDREAHESTQGAL